MNPRKFGDCLDDVRRYLAQRPEATSALVYGSVALATARPESDLDLLVVAQLLFLQSEDPEKEIALYINSPGGQVTAGLAIYDTMRYIRPDIVTLCIGQAASMGSLLLAAGAKGKRYALPHARIMIHQPSGGFQGQATDIEIHAKEILSLRERLDEPEADPARGLRHQAPSLGRKNFAR